MNLYILRLTPSIWPQITVHALMRSVLLRRYHPFSIKEEAVVELVFDAFLVLISTLGKSNY